MAFLEERLPVGEQGLDFLEQLVPNDLDLARRIDCQFGYVVVTQEILVLEQHRAHTV